MVHESQITKQKQGSSPAAATIYENSLEHLLDELRRVDLIIHSRIERWRSEQRTEIDDLRGLYISEDEVDAILQTPSGELEKGIYPDPVSERIEAAAGEINRKKAESLKQGKELRLHILSELFHLNAFEIDILLICLASELELRYEKLYSYLQDDVTKKRPSVDLVINLLCSSLEEKFRARRCFSPAAPLIKSRIIYLSGDSHLPLLSRHIKVDERIISFLLGADEVDQSIRDFSTIIEPKRFFEEIISADDTKDALPGLIKRQSGKKIPMFFFHGPYGTGKKMTAEAVCRELGLSLLVVDSKYLKGSEASENLKLVIREALLQKSSVYLEGFDFLVGKDTEAGVNAVNLIRELDNFPNWIFLSGELPWDPPGLLNNHSFISLAFHVPSFELRKRLWSSFLKGNGDADIAVLASKFKFSGGQIKDAISTAVNIAMVKTPIGPKLSMEDLYSGCKAQSNRNLVSFARKIEPRYTWDEIILPGDIKEHLKEVSGYIKYKGTVYTDWGFDKKLSLGKGLNVLFSGPSGTGKTMAAEIIARDAELDLYKIDLSGVVSKYIGETEKNLKNIFKEAETSNAILFFDEADALFGKRSEVRDSHDRYANIEINYLLQKMEEYEGIVILATNFSNNIDEAFLRRMHFKIDFPSPDEELREKIWKNIFPKEMPFGDDIDYSFLSKFKITGGNIKNIALSAAFLAAGDSCAVKMEHIILGTRREFQKMGKLCIPEDFGEYYEIVRERILDID
ncbi:MAG: ATP-binding protein [Candidatus Methanoperedens sp.]|nr:ATP-binding protein [Candidatus Methanoperedens sp.]